MAKKIPDLCKDCKNSDFFKEDANCWVYWDGKSDCITRFWLEKE